jgi:chemotaxis protein MotC
MRKHLRLGLLLALGTCMPFGLHAAEPETPAAIAPYKMVRTLQNIQDMVIAGDLESVEMQRFLLGEIDKRLRSADASVFDDPRNVDAALIYAMSGGNPATLDALADRDISGNFDTRIVSVLRRYLSGRGGTALKMLKEIVPEYRSTRLGPYLTLIGANALMEKEPELALTYFDWARSASPGTIIEEAALRRALAITSRKGDTARALPFARRYARRYMNSPYASQFAEIFVNLAIDHKEALPPTEITEVLSLVERRRQREIYLRLARRAAIDGDKELAEYASGMARGLSKEGEEAPLALAELYSGIVEIPSDGIENVLSRISGLPDASLSPKDRFLRDAATVVAEAVIGPPSEESLTQVRQDIVDKEYRDRMSERARGASKATDAAVSAVEPDASAKQPDGTAQTRKQALDARIGEVEDFVGLGRAKINEIDALLVNESK